jgi:AraC-like DNA-binding protein
LSPSRFMHVFTESVGVPVRPYILWLRLQRAACDLMTGTSVTSAAHNAGFSDAAHLTRTFRRMLGTTPTDLALRKRLSQGLALESSQTGTGALRPTVRPARTTLIEKGRATRASGVLRDPGGTPPISLRAVDWQSR